MSALNPAEVTRVVLAVLDPHGQEQGEVWARCGQCGCWAYRACPGGCGWISGVYPPLCSACVDQVHHEPVNDGRKRCDFCLGSGRLPSDPSCDCIVCHGRGFTFFMGAGR